MTKLISPNPRVAIALMLTATAFIAATTLLAKAIGNGSLGAPLHPMQEAFRDNHGLQCGFCTPGMIMTAIDIVRRNGHDLEDHVIREEHEGNLCRCTGYDKIIHAVMEVAAEMRESAK